MLAVDRVQPAGMVGALFLPAWLMNMLATLPWGRTRPAALSSFNGMELA